MKKKAGYEYLLAYKITVAVYDLTVEFCRRYIKFGSRTNDQMVQAARSGMQNVSEGNKQQGMKGYIKLCGVSRGSLEELLKDYLAFARQNKLEIWPREKAIRENPTASVNLMITLINQANYLIDKLIVSLKEKHMKEGGLTEELYRRRIAFRRQK